jgi:hypothetical protein
MELLKTGLVNDTLFLTEKSGGSLLRDNGQIAHIRPAGIGLYLREGDTVHIVRMLSGMPKV